MLRRFSINDDTFVRASLYGLLSVLKLAKRLRQLGERPRLVLVEAFLVHVDKVEAILAGDAVHVLALLPPHFDAFSRR